MHTSCACLLRSSFTCTFPPLRWLLPAVHTLLPSPPPAVAVDKQAEFQKQLNLSPRLASRICKYFDKQPGPELDTLGIQLQLAQNPYALCRVLPGYTLEQAEEVARALGFNPAAPERGAAYLQVWITCWIGAPCVFCPTLCSCRQCAARLGACRRLCRLAFSVLLCSNRR